MSRKTIQCCWGALCSFATSVPLQCMYSSGILGKICVLWRATVGDSVGSVRLLWRSELERLGIIHFIFIILTVVESHAARVWVSLKRALMCVR